MYNLLIRENQNDEIIKLEHLMLDPNKMDNVQNSLIKEAIQYIYQNYMNDLSLDEVADYLGINKYYFSHLFKEEMQTSFVRYLTNLRVKMVLYLITKKNYMISELAKMTGYRDETYLCKVVKKHTGKTINEIKKIYCRSRRSTKTNNIDKLFL